VPDDEGDDQDPFNGLQAGRAQLFAGGPWPPFGAGGPRRCSFCGRREDSVRHLVRARDAYICDECVELAGEAIAAAPPDRVSLTIRRRRAARPDREAAEAEIERVFETAIGGDTSDGERMRLIEGGSNLGPTLQLVRQRLPRDQRPDTYVEYVRIISEDEAEVHFVLVYPGGIPAPPRFPFTGHAVRSDGRWKVARETWCRLIGSIGIPCPPPPA
jgi:ClpX C4-type zinc finger